MMLKIAKECRNFGSDNASEIPADRTAAAQSRRGDPMFGGKPVRQRQKPSMIRAAAVHQDDRMSRHIRPRYIRLNRIDDPGAQLPAVASAIFDKPSCQGLACPSRVLPPDCGQEDCPVVADAVLPCLVQQALQVLGQGPRARNRCKAFPCRRLNLGDRQWREDQP